MIEITRGLPNVSFKIEMNEWWRDETDSHLNENANKEIMKKLARKIQDLL